MSQTFSMSNSILDHWFGLTSPTVPTNWYMGISTSSISPDGSGISEPTSDPNYARVAIANSKVSFTTSSNGSLSNAVQFTFPESTISWGTITHFFLSDAATSGNIKVYGALTASRTVESQTTLILAVGALQINLQNIA